MARFYKAIARIDFDTSGLTGNYQSINAGGIEEPCLFIEIDNDSANDISISLDGSTDNYILLGNSFGTIPLAAFTSETGAEGVWKKTQEFWVKSSSADAGTLYVSGFYL